MSKPNPSAEMPAEVGIMSVLTPMQESFERFRKASERLSTIYTEIAADQAHFLQHALFDTLSEARSLSRVRAPSEFLVEASELAWLQAERSLKVFGEIGNEVCTCWFEALKAASGPAPKTAKSRAPH